MFYLLTAGFRILLGTSGLRRAWDNYDVRLTGIDFSPACRRTREWLRVF
ncbi:hypothetical protein LWC34_15175 [Kibdelosporangium philippinense]|uniref:Uncharacterized protein n=1 Tax=Kibdelosporangium philippinense TaxID=211113 RepID=A0ABS8ZBV3_9PSEU|nr:hypothetical protein [Kibdelosporangium philippinense]MCE7004166.1 hypothetical protein [Kibdelosporangium philippinense]